MPHRSSILLATLNASFPHAAFGLRYLLANMAELSEQTSITEFTINQRISDIVANILARSPDILGLGVYIWNAEQTQEVVSSLKRMRPDLCIVLGGPEVSYETEEQEIVRLADYVITGEADLVFRDLCRELISARRPERKIIPAPLPVFSQLALPYHLYSGEDIAHRVVYVEASRGCPFTCEFCLSSLDIPVRAVPLERLLPALQDLLDRGLRQFKFVDRTFNLNLNTSRALLEFFLERMRPGLFLHFEMIPDRLPEGLREIISRFPPGALQFEVGIQTFDELTSRNISRRNNHVRTEENFRYLRGNTGVHIHADLIVGLPGEDVASFGRGFDRLVAMEPQEIQVGILKRLRGTPIVRHDAEWEMVYARRPPYEVLQTRLIPPAEMQEMRRFAKYWDLIGNSGNFVTTLPLVWQEEPSPFVAFRRFANFLWERTGKVDGIALLTLVELTFHWLTESKNIPVPLAATHLWNDYIRPGRHGDKPPRWLARHLSGRETEKAGRFTELPSRQARHAQNSPST
ncbi:MAG TPA: DUF4080 domain-containing protein [Verrucomicrobiales bacterium]|jgi:radical SAM superfamily enzyme YgiQ (UPF0313 family)|nr:DUF4080 domain-containing protein [Verrucomicrobiales bacterium]